MTAQSHFPHELLQGKKSTQLQEMLWQERGVNWNDLPTGFKRGRLVERVAVKGDVVYTNRRTGQECEVKGITRHVWRINVEPPIFSQEQGWLLARIPQEVVDETAGG